MTNTAPPLTLRQRIPSIQIFVRHSPGCTYAGDENWRRCACRKHRFFEELLQVAKRHRFTIMP